MISSRAYSTSAGGLPLGGPLALLLLALAIMILPAWAEALQYDRAAIADGELWRLVTWHFAHWSWDHLLWDAAAFAGLTFCACRLRLRLRHYATCLAAAALLISATTWVMQPGFTHCRGLSGLDAALFGLVIGSMALQSWREHRPGHVALMVGAMLLLLAKCLFELTFGTTLFVDSTAAQMVPMPLAHLVGALTGLGFSLLSVARGHLIPLNAGRGISRQCPGT